MGEFKSGLWIIGILIYFFLFFTIMVSITASQTILNIKQSSSVSFNDPGFQNQSSFFKTGRGCGGTGDTMNWLSGIPCPKLDIDNQDYNACNNISGCVWRNETNLFGVSVIEAECRGYVNQSAMNIDGNSKEYCFSSGLQNRSICTTFRCQWLNASEFSQIQIDTFKPQGTLSVLWNTVSMVATFNVDFNLKHYTFLFSFLFFWIPLIGLIIALYFALPFLH